ncbi:pentatricopeptide repeat (PPR) superfamily protein [Tasmannia lanceolata]|uniref:pentatricopeptide repeat (PPR) superfamily protein n=1 Tax=Tasmannia lanceolata TaxID=3420 RepID=UPI0040634C09
MEMLVKKYQQKYRRVRDEMSRWDELQTQLLTQFRNASSIIERLEVLRNTKNYGELTHISGITKVLLGKQMESLNCIFGSMKRTMKEFQSIVISLEKILRDGRQLLKGGSMQPTMHQMQLRVGIRPSLAQCLDGLKSLYEMHHSEYLLKSSTISALTLNSSASDMGGLHQLLADQPNIPKEEVQFIFNIIFPEEIS